MVRRLSVIAVAIGLCLVGAGCSGEDRSGAARTVAPAVRTQAELQSALLRVDDLPSGYSQQPATSEPPEPPDAGGQGGGAEPCAQVFAQLQGGESAMGKELANSVRVEFSKGDFGPFLQQGLVSSADQETVKSAIDGFRQLPTMCGEFTETDESGVFTIKLSETKFAAMGDETYAVKIDSTGRSSDIDVVLAGYIVLARVGSTVCMLVHFGIPGVDIAETEKITRAAVARLT